MTQLFFWLLVSNDFWTTQTLGQIPLYSAHGDALFRPEWKWKMVAFWKVTIGDIPFVDFHEYGRKDG